METKMWKKKKIEKILKKLSPQKPYALWGWDFVEMFIILAFISLVGCRGNLGFPLTYNGENWKTEFIAEQLQIFWQNFYRNDPWKVLFQPYIFGPLLVFGLGLACQAKGYCCHTKKSTLAKIFTEKNE